MSRIFDQGNAALNDFMKELRHRSVEYNGSHGRKEKQKVYCQRKVNIRQGDFEETAYNDKSFDKICSANTIYFWPDPDNCIKKILRILKPGGKLILAFEDKEQLEKKPLNTNVFHFYSQDGNHI